MTNIRISLLCFGLLTSGCYDFSIPAPDSGLSDGSTVDSGNVSTESVTGNGRITEKPSASAAGASDALPGADSGDAGTPSTSGCDLSSCANGCCSDHRCVPLGDQSNILCGKRGTACAPCADDQECDSKGSCVCSPKTCPHGCCFENRCVTKTSQSTKLCGSNGNECRACDTGEACFDGVCSCGNESCSGCCSRGVCVASTNSSCGVGGGQCIACDSKQKCNAQGDCVCDASSCPNGCCDEDDKCITPSATACGTNGEECVKCTLQHATEDCNGGKCSIAKCEDTWGDCDKNAANGCERTLTTTAHCGKCEACSKPANASSSSCNDGTCFFTCLTGYEDNGSSCVPVDCGSLLNPTNGTVSMANGTTFENIATYSCNERYVLGGNDNSNTRTCRADGLWSGSSPTCKLGIYCGDGKMNGDEKCDWSAPDIGTWRCSTDCKTPRTVYTACSSSGDCDSNSQCQRGTSGSSLCTPNSGLGLDGSGVPSDRCPKIQGGYTQKFFSNAYCVIECASVSGCPSHLGLCVASPFANAGQYEATKFCVPQ